MNRRSVLQSVGLLGAGVAVGVILERPDRLHRERRRVGFEDASDGVESDVVVSNRTDERVDVTVTFGEVGGNGPVSDGTVTLPPEGFGSYGGVFTLGTVYDVRFEAAGMVGHTRFLNSATNSLWVTVEEDDVSVDLGEA